LFGDALRVDAGECLQAAKRTPQRRESPLGLRAGSARGRTGIARAASPSGPDGTLDQQPHGGASSSDPASRSRCPRCSSKSEWSLSLRRRSSPASSSSARWAVRISSTNCSRHCCPCINFRESNLSVPSLTFLVSSFHKGAGLVADPPRSTTPLDSFWCKKSRLS
jgi:hypothetical protein